MNKRIGLLVAAGAAALVLTGGTAFASIPDAQGVIYGCYDTGGNLKVIDTSVTPSCPKGYSALDWNQTGPAGQQGPQGPQGPAGATGTQGPSGPAGAAGATGATGPQGPAGAAGVDGSNGTNIVTSAGAPSGFCNAGDTDVDLADGEVYSCNVAAVTPDFTWSDTGSSLEGPQGPAGPTGPAGPQGPQGPQGPPGPAGPGGGMSTAYTGFGSAEFFIGLLFNTVQTMTPPDGTYLLTGSISLQVTDSVPTADTRVACELSDADGTSFYNQDVHSTPLAGNTGSGLAQIPISTVAQVNSSGKSILLQCNTTESTDSLADVTALSQLTAIPLGNVTQLFG